MDPLKEAMLKRAYGEGNINLFTRPQLKNPDGSTSTLYSMGIGDDDGNEWVIPGIDEHASRPLLNNAEAWDQFKKTGHYLGKFKSPEEGEAYGEKLHEDAEAGYYTPPLASSHKSVDPNQLQKVLDFYLRGKR